MVDSSGRMVTVTSERGLWCPNKTNMAASATSVVGRVASLFFSKNVENKSKIKSFQVILPPLYRLL